MKNFIPLEVPEFPGFYYTECADNLAVNLDGNVLYLVDACIKKITDMQCGLEQKVGTTRLGGHNLRKIKSLIYYAMFGEPADSRVTGAFILKGIGQIRTTPESNRAELAANIHKSDSALPVSTLITYISRGTSINGVTYVDLFDLPADERKALLKDWIAFKQGKVNIMTHIPKQVSPTLRGFYVVNGYPEIACSINGDILFLHNFKLAPTTLNCYTFEQKMKSAVTMGVQRKTITVARAWWLAFFGPIPGDCPVTGCWIVREGDKILEGPYCSVADIKRRGDYAESIEVMRKKLYGARILGGKKFINLFATGNSTIRFIQKAVIEPANQQHVKGI